MEGEYTVVEIIRDPRMWVYETNELTRKGHYYLYRFDAAEGIFYRATVPSGAAELHFRILTAADKVPLDGWQVVEQRGFPKGRLQTV
ncbi:MAG: hypothetical protein JSU72_17310, partial [Deltaproteobacteria bacterium]